MTIPFFFFFYDTEVARFQLVTVDLLRLDKSLLRAHGLVRDFPDNRRRWAIAMTNNDAHDTTKSTTVTYDDEAYGDDPLRFIVFRRTCVWILVEDQRYSARWNAGNRLLRVGHRVVWNGVSRRRHGYPSVAPPQCRKPETCTDDGSDSGFWFCACDRTWVRLHLRVDTHLCECVC